VKPPKKNIILQNPNNKRSLIFKITPIVKTKKEKINTKKKKKKREKHLEKTVHSEAASVIYFSNQHFHLLIP
jgi:hypothetical protein